MPARYVTSYISYQKFFLVKFFAYRKNKNHMTLYNEKSTKKIKLEKNAFITPSFITYINQL